MPKTEINHASTVFIAQIRSIFNFWGYKFINSIILFLIGFIIVLGLPVMSFWVVAILSGLAFLVKGMTKMTLSLANRNTYNI